MKACTEKEKVNIENYFVIQVLDELGNWYNNAYVENDYDAIRIAKFYKTHLGYSIKVFTPDGIDWTSILDSIEIVLVKKMKDNGEDDKKWQVQQNLPQKP